MNKIRPTRFFFHYYRQYDCMSVHFKKTCYKVKDVKCSVPVETKWNGRQPKLVIQGFARTLNIENEIAYLN